MTNVSIIIPCLHQSRPLDRTVDSCFAQTHPAVETLVVDVGSSADAARHSGRPRFLHIRQTNINSAAARNLGVAESTGDYLCFLAPGDWYEPEKISRQAALLDANPELGWVYCDATLVDDHGQPLPDQSSVADSGRIVSGDVFDSLVQSPYFQTHTVMIRRAVLDQVGGFDTDLGDHADYDLWLRVAGAGFKTVFIPEHLAGGRAPDAGVIRDGGEAAATRLAAFRKLAKNHPERAARGLARLQQSLDDRIAADQWRRLAPAANSADLLARIQEHAELTIRWRSKLEAGIALAAVRQNAAAAKFMVDAVQSVQTCTVPEVIIEALIEVAGQLAPLDLGRARYLLNLGRQLASDLGNQPACERAQVVLASFPKTSSPAARPRTSLAPA